jgi:tetrahydromethanopterin S-methyltransferase subunit A
MLNELGRYLKKLAPRPSRWPFVRGDYVVLDPAAPVVIVGAHRTDAQNELARSAPVGLCMLATVRTAKEAADLLHALATNLSIQALIWIGDESAKQPLGTAFAKLGRDDEAPPGAVGSLMNAMASHVDADELAKLRKRVTFKSLIGCDELPKIVNEIESARAGAHRPDTGIVTREEASGVPRVIVPRDVQYEVRDDKTGQFRVRLEEQSIVVEHLNGKSSLLRTIEGKTARDLCVAIVRNGWISKLDHAAYLGRELARAEYCLRNGQPFRQDSVEPAADRRAEEPGD